MTEEYVIYQKFTDLQTAEAIALELTNNGIQNKLVNNVHAYVNFIGYNPIDFAVAINIMPQDIPAADKILETYYRPIVDDIDPDYYLFNFSIAELKEIIAKPYEWGLLDYQLARKILAEKGEDISDSTVQQIKKTTIDELSVKEKVSAAKIFTGYILAIFFPFFSILIGLGIINNRKILPTGEKFYIHPEDDRKHGKRMIIISVGWICIAFAILIIEKMQTSF